VDLFGRGVVQHKGERGAFSTKGVVKRESDASDHNQKRGKKKGHEIFQGVGSGRARSYLQIKKREVY